MIALLVILWLISFQIGFGLCVYVVGCAREAAAAYVWRSRCAAGSVCALPVPPVVTYFDVAQARANTQEVWELIMASGALRAVPERLH